MEMRAATLVDDRAARPIIKRDISYYAITNSKELVAEAYTLSRHPDFGTLPRESQQMVNYILTGERA
jgi:hypothetical protein